MACGPRVAPVSRVCRVAPAARVAAVGVLIIGTRSQDRLSGMDGVWNRIVSLRYRIVSYDPGPGLVCRDRRGRRVPPLLR